MFGSQSGLFSCVLNMMAVHQSPLVSCWQLDASCDIHSIQCVSAVHACIYIPVSGLLSVSCRLCSLICLFVQGHCGVHDGA